MKRIGRLIPAFLAAFLLATAFPVAAVSPSVLEPDATGCYRISSAAQLTEFAERVNAGEDFSDTPIHLTCDLRVGDTTDKAARTGTETDNPWIPIGTAEHPFRGAFYGNGYSVGGIYTASSQNGAGLFGYIESASIEDLTVCGSYIGGGSRVGGIAGSAVNSAITGCTNLSPVSGSTRVGGIVGDAAGLTLENCVNAGAVTGQRYVGGIAGIVSGSIQSSINQGAVTSAEGGDNIGGIAGRSRGTLTIADCYVCGTVSGFNEYLGGLIGAVAHESCSLARSYVAASVIRTAAGETQTGSDITVSDTFGDGSNTYGPLWGAKADDTSLSRLYYVGQGTDGHAVTAAALAALAGADAFPSPVWTSGSGQYTYPCLSAVSTLPKVTVTFTDARGNELQAREMLLSDLPYYTGSAPEKFACTFLGFTNTDTPLQADTVCAAVFSDPPIRVGDTNRDGSITVTDAVTLRRCLAGGYGVETFLPTMDINLDGYLSIADVVMLRRYLAGGYGVVLP